MDIDRERLGEGALRVNVPLVTVVIPCYNQAHFLGEAIESVLSQSYPHHEIVVVDDGSTDDTSEVASRYPEVRLIRQENRGLSGARNRGLAESSGEYVVFLDADDRLLEEALEVGVRELEAHPECAFVAGHCKIIAADGSPSDEQMAARSPRTGSDLYTTLLSREHFVIPGTVMHRRSVFDSVGWFDPAVDGAADYEFYFRIAREYPVRWHQRVILEYRRHDASMTRNANLMLQHTVTVLRSQRTYAMGDQRLRKAYKTGLKSGGYEYGMPIVEEVKACVRRREWAAATRGMLVLVQYFPRGLAELTLPAPVRRWLKTLLRLLRNRPPVGWVRFGNLRRVRPISREFGYDRGQPIDRYYIEEFLNRHTEDIQGRVLEIGDATYTRRFGGGRVTVSDVLHVTRGNPHATIVADLARADHIPSDYFDCIIFTQTLHLIYDAHSAIQTLHRILRPDGVLLATFPGISNIARDQWGDEWYWAFTSQSARRLFEEVFPSASITVEAHGNVLGAIAFLHGLAVGELRREELEYRDPSYELVITLRAMKPEATPPTGDACEG